MEDHREPAGVRGPGRDRLRRSERPDRRLERPGTAWTPTFRFTPSYSDLTFSSRPQRREALPRRSPVSRSLAGVFSRSGIAGPPAPRRARTCLVRRRGPARRRSRARRRPGHGSEGARRDRPRGRVREERGDGDARAARRKLRAARLGRLAAEASSPSISSVRARCSSTRTAHSLLFATEVVDLLGLLTREPRADEGAVVRWLVSGTLEPGETLFAGVRRLPGGCHLRLADGRWSEHRHWRPRFTTPSEHRHSKTQARRSEGARAKRRPSAAPDRPAGVLLSGGLDSTSVAAVARASGRADRCARTRRCSRTTPPPTSRSSSTSRSRSLGLRRADEAAAEGVLAASAEHVREWRLPAASPNLFFQRPLLERARDDGVGLVLDGQGGDELFGCSPYLLGDLLRRVRLGALRRRSRELDGDARTTRERFERTRSAAPLPSGWSTRVSTSTRARAALAQARRGRPRRRCTGPPRVATARRTALVGVARRHPHGRAGADGRARPPSPKAPVAEPLRRAPTAGRSPPDRARAQSPAGARLRPELDRPVLRRAMSGLVPEPIRLRRTKSVFNTLLVDALSGPDRPLLTGLLEPRDAEIRAYVTEDRLRDVVGRPESRKQPVPLGAERLAARIDGAVAALARGRRIGSLTLERAVSS